LTDCIEKVIRYNLCRMAREIGGGRIKTSKEGECLKEASKIRRGIRSHWSGKFHTRKKWERGEGVSFERGKVSSGRGEGEDVLLKQFGSRRTSKSTFKTGRGGQTNALAEGEAIAEGEVILAKKGTQLIT